MYQRAAIFILQKSNADVQYETEQPSHELVCSEEKQRGEHNHNQNHGRGDHGLATRRPMYFQRFGSNLAQKRNWIGLGCH